MTNSDLAMTASDPAVDASDLNTTSSDPTLASGDPTVPASAITSRSNAASNNPAQLFLDAPDKTAEASSKFITLTECTYTNKSLGSSGQKETMTCDCPEEWDEASGSNHACGEESNCINRVTSVECTNTGCLCGQDCQNQRFQKRQYCEVKVVQTENKGYGLAAQQTIAEHLFIYEYVGEIIDEATFRQRMVEYDTRQLRHFYFMMLTKDAFIDATEKGCLARFCNHSCSPNAYVDKWVVGDRLRMGIFAKRDILPGEEITFDYNVDRYGAQLQPCYCLAANCPGWMGGKTQTNAALLLPDGLSEALGVTQQQERAWIKHNKRLGKANSDSLATQQFVQSISVAPLTDADVTRAMSALMKAEEPGIVEKLVERVYLTEDPRINSLVVKFHGYKTLSRVMKEHTANEPLVTKILVTLRRWPSMTRNKIELSQIERVVQDIVETLHNEQILQVARELLAEWSKLKMAYRIPKNGLAREEAAPSPLYGRNPRLELPGRADDAANDLEALPDGWQKALDPNSNTHYYYHREMGISKWEKPTSMPKGPKTAERKNGKNGKESSKESGNGKNGKGGRESSKEGANGKNGKESGNGKENGHGKESGIGKNDIAKPHKHKDNFAIHEDLLRKQKEEQYNEVLQKEKMLQSLIAQAQVDAVEKKRLEEQAKSDRIAKHKERRRRKEQALGKAVGDDKRSTETLWTRTLARHVPNLIKRHEAEIGHDNVKGCARELVKVLASKEAKKENNVPPAELDAAKVKKLKVFCGDWMEKFLVKYKAKKARASHVP